MEAFEICQEAYLLARHEQESMLLGRSYMKPSAFREKTETLREATDAQLLNALQVLGEQAGRDFLSLQGPIDRRLAAVLDTASRIRKDKLDGFGLVGGLLKKGSRFARGFYKTSGLEPRALSEDLRRCHLYRSGGLCLSPDEKARLGFADEEMNDEGR
ncbi:hypothetical protein ACFSKY_23195 [Azotobacter chroococcum]|uniref:Uncharacterized protein n=1 Tax=Azotobacter chroococcum TaxID=353 RepID=A0A4R1NZ48_9GAMM|nr:hypothetical protein [Azotobacter chroococcum]TBV93293.1 hypothetical protein E0E53_17340 [Azotobacter chroococcum]TCL18319.1 hypothetical protein EV691_15112 [Azotobacter chroococcum]